MQRLSEWSAEIRHEVRLDIGVLRQRLDLMAPLVEGLDDLRADFVDEYLDRWGQFYELLLSEGEAVQEATQHYLRVLAKRREVQSIWDMSDILFGFQGAVAEVQDANVSRLWGVYEQAGLPASVKEAADRMVDHHKSSTDTPYAYMMRQLINRIMKRFEVDEFEYERWRGVSIESIVAGAVQDYERGITAMHAISYAVLRRVAAEAPSPVFGRDGTIRLARILTDVAEFQGRSSLRVVSTGSSPYQVFKIKELWKLGVTRVPVRRILTDFLLHRLFYNESERLLMGGARWHMVFEEAMESEMTPLLETMTGAEQRLLLLRIMHLWDEADDEQVVPLLQQLWEEIRSAREQE